MKTPIPPVRPASSIDLPPLDGPLITRIALVKEYTRVISGPFTSATPPGHLIHITTEDRVEPGLHRNPSRQMVDASGMAAPALPPPGQAPAASGR